MNYEPCDITIEVAENALSYCNYNDRDEWLKMGMAIKSEFGELGFDVWDAWSTNYTKYKASEAKIVWKSFKGRGISIGTLIDAALKDGFKFEPIEMDAATRETLNKKREEEQKKRQAEEEEQAQKIANYRSRLSDVLTAAVNESDAFSQSGRSPYLDEKMVGAFGVLFPNKPLIIINDDEKFLSEVIAGHEEFSRFLSLPGDEKPKHRIIKAGSVIVPLYDENFKIHNLQVIYNTGTKRFLRGRKKGCFHIVGAVPISGKFNIAFSEGYANAASIHIALGCPVVVCFDAGGYLPICQTIQKMFGDRVNKYLFCADDDQHLGMGKNKGVIKATEAADLVGGIVILPKIDAVADKDDDTDSLYVEAVEFVASKQKCSISALQNELRIGYNRAARLVDIMQNKKIVSEANEKGKREVLVEKFTKEMNEQVANDE